MRSCASDFGHRTPDSGLAELIHPRAWFRRSTMRGSVPCGEWIARPSACAPFAPFHSPDVTTHFPTLNVSETEPPRSPPQPVPLEPLSPLFFNNLLGSRQSSVFHDQQVICFLEFIGVAGNPGVLWFLGGRKSLYPLYFQ